MSEWDVYEFLEKQRVITDRFFSIIEMKTLMNNEGFNVNERTLRLQAWQLHRKGYLERELSGDANDWSVRFRLNAKYQK